jgi:replicative DNA helicase
MRSLHRAVRNPDKGGVPLPQTFKDFDKYDIHFRRGELVMIAGPPGAGKSTVALAVAMAMRVPTLYFSMDSGEETQEVRSLAMLTGMTTKQIEIELAADREGGASLIKDKASHIKWDWDSESLWDVEEEFQIYEEIMGEPPQLVILDNATDISHESGDEYQSLRALMRELKRWARTANVCFVALHHTSEEYNGNPCPPMKSVHGKINQKPALILTIGNSYQGFLPIAPVKNRSGFADKSGGTAVWLHYEPATMTLRDSL